MKVTPDGPGTLSDATGAFELREIPPGEHVIQVSRIGYEVFADTMLVDSAVVLQLDVHLAVDHLEVAKVVVTARRKETNVHSEQAAVSLSSRDLATRTPDTIADALEGEVGVAERSMGSAPARPVVRGLGDNRLAVLEDGENTGDLSATSADHAVAIEPLNARSIEVIRGPAALLYGSTVLAGVVDVQRQYIPAVRLERFRSTAAATGASVNSSSAIQFRVEGPAGPTAFLIDASLRNAGDTRTPAGVLTNTEVFTTNGSVGVGLARNWGNIGISVNTYNSDYGIPGGFLGGHPNGADIELEKRSVEGRGQIHLGQGVLNRIEFNGRYSRYFHRELESNDVCGVSFGQLTYDGSTRLTYRIGPNLPRGVVGVSTRYRDYATGCLSFIPQTVERTTAVFAYNEARIGRSTWRASLRYESRSMNPAESGRNKAGQIHPRQFSGWSAGLAVDREYPGNLTLGTSVGLAFRAPSLEELYSEGPHLASFAYEVGNADLDSERGQGAELSVEWHPQAGHLRGAVFINRFQDYIHVVDTGELEYGPGEEGFLALYQYRGQDTHFAGVEIQSDWTLSGSLALSASASYVNGTLTKTGQPLPRVPPGMASLGFQYTHGEVTFHAGIQGALAQRRLGEFEEATNGYVLGNAAIEWVRAHPWLEHSVVIRVDNLTNVEYRNHLSRIKSIMPEPGRSISVLYRVSVK